MQIGSRQVSGHQVADLLVLVVLSSFVLWYARDTYSASSHILNLVLVLPVSAIVLALCLVEFLGQTIRGQPEREAKERETVTSVAPLILLFSLYVITLGWLGFDVGTTLFVACSLWLHGERRLRWVVGYAICFAVLASLLFSQMLPYPMPMLLLPTGS